MCPGVFHAAFVLGLCIMFDKTAIRCCGVVFLLIPGYDYKVLEQGMCCTTFQHEYWEFHKNCILIIVSVSVLETTKGQTGTRIQIQSPFPNFSPLYDSYGKYKILSRILFWKGYLGISKNVTRQKSYVENMLVF